MPRPLAHGSISLGLHTLDGVDGADIAGTLVDQARCAEAVGFDGVTISEHHGTFPGYMGQPLLAATWILGATQRIWAGPSPYLLNLRNPLLAAEELAWSAARFGGRFAAAVAPGYAETDYDLLDVPFRDDRTARFEAGLHALTARLSGADGASVDAAIAQWRAAPAPLLCAANSRPGARRAGRLGLGVLFPSGSAHDRMRELIGSYRDAGGTGPVVKIRQLWLGTPPPESLQRREAVYRGAAAKGMRQAEGFREPFLHGDDTHVAEQLVTDVQALGLTGLNVRLHLAGADRSAIAAQIERFGTTVLPALRAAFAGGPVPRRRPRRSATRHGG
jgi:alkanesulfonate monooxygenase SsuD/methylene tetrahydromethanopterin reductase-like flavin-dependent oxidoreductase (luciferase family)